MTICPYCAQGATSIDMRDIGQHLRKWRKAHGYTLQEVHHQVGITVSHLSDIERTNRSLSLETLIKLLDLYGIEFVYTPASISRDYRPLSQGDPP